MQIECDVRNATKESRFLEKTLYHVEGTQPPRVVYPIANSRCNRCGTHSMEDIEESSGESLPRLGTSCLKLGPLSRPLVRC